jgi:hypothetical protein
MPRPEVNVPVALDIHVIRDSGVHRVKIFSEGRRIEGFEFYLQLLPAIEHLSNAAQNGPSTDE